MSIRETQNVLKKSTRLMKLWAMNKNEKPTMLPSKPNAPLSLLTQPKPKISQELILIFIEINLFINNNLVLLSETPNMLIF